MEVQQSIWSNEIREVLSSDVASGMVRTLKALIPQDADSGMYVCVLLEI